MKIAVTTPTGHVGSAVADRLLDIDDCEVKLLGRRPNTLTRFLRRGAEVAVGAQDDAKYLTRATLDVDALFWVTPPGYGSDNVRAFQNRLAQAAATAIRENHIPRVVNLSSIGAQLNAGVGPIGGLHDVESVFDEAAENIVHLRPGFFFENLLWQMDAIRNTGTISLPISGTRRYPMIATCDIARVACEWLMDTTWTGYHVRELHGPRDLSFDEVAGVLSEALGRRISYVRCDRPQAQQMLISSGMSENATESLLEMYEAVDAGRLRPLQPRSDETITRTTLAEFAREVMLPLVPAAASH